MNRLESKKQTNKQKSPSAIHLLDDFGPGIVTGAADDDPSGVGTYTIAGSQLGYSLLWTAWFTWPLMASVQLMCAHISLASQKSLTEALLLKFSRKTVGAIVFALFFANVLNVAADLSAMGDALEILTGQTSIVYIVVIGLILTGSMIFLSYRAIARALTWMTFFLFAYVFTAMKVTTDWNQLFLGTFSIKWPSSSAEWAVLVAILGTTISPYLFFWQSSQEVEEIQTNPNFNFSKIKARRNWDVLLGTFVSNIIMYFIIWTSAGSLNAAGITNLETSKQAAEALEPLLGKSALLVYTIGILGVGMLAIPTLVGSASLAVANVFKWESGLNKKWYQARTFYLFLIFTMLSAMAMDLLNMNPIRALFYSSIFNGVLSPILLFICLAIARDQKIMNEKPVGRILLTMVSLTALIMTFAALGLLI